MRRHRPTVVLVMAILNMVFGSLGLACYLCFGVGLAALLGLMSSMPAKDKAALTDMVSSMDDALPSYKYVMIGTLVLSLLMTSWLIVCGIGLLGMKPWARWGSVFYAIATIVITIGGFIYNQAYANPALARWTEKMQQEMARKQGMATPAPVRTNPVMSGAQGGVGMVFSMAYSIALLIVMFLPHVSAAFAGEMPRSERHVDYYDEPREPDDRIRPARDDWHSHSE